MSAECRVEIVDGEPIRVRGDRPMTDEGRAAFADVVRAAKKMMAETPRHFAPYGSTAALCGVPVPRLIGWDESRGEYRSIRFTTSRDDTSCEDCRQRMTGPATRGEHRDA